MTDAYKNISRTEVALRFASAIREETYLTEEGFKNFEIRPALELQIQ